MVSAKRHLSFAEVTSVWSAYQIVMITDPGREARLSLRRRWAQAASFEVSDGMQIWFST